MKVTMVYLKGLWNFQKKFSRRVNSDPEICEIKNLLIKYNDIENDSTSVYWYY